MVQFKNPVRNDSGCATGWWCYEAGDDHFDDWVMHGLPHILVLHDLVKSISYWVHVTSEQISETGNGCIILVPID
ncbi:MAG: DUF4365 domain-containing protein [Oceanococcus sp.]|nr:MAG: DUF4365 domain-containing protein [Oceanococcus sp.]